MEECDALRERVKMAAETHVSEQRRMRENLCDLETRLKHVEKERQELLLTQGTKKATISGLEGQLDDTRDELRRTKQELATQRTQYFQLRYILHSFRILLSANTGVSTPCLIVSNLHIHFSVQL